MQQAQEHTTEPQGLLPPSESFAKLRQVILDGKLPEMNKKKLEDLRVILHMIMHECSKANIETGKTWVFDHCQTPLHVVVFMEYILSLTNSRPSQEERIHMLYLINDVLYHAARKHFQWMLDAMSSLLVPFLKLIYTSAESIEYKAKVIKVINIWSEKNVLDPSIIQDIRQRVTAQQQQLVQPLPLAPAAEIIPPFPPQQQQYMYQHPYYASPPIQQHTQFNIFPQKIQHSTLSPSSSVASSHATISPPKQYFDLPAGLMVLAKNQDYKPIDTTMIKPLRQLPPPSQDLLSAVHDFYTGLDFSNQHLQDDIVLLDEKALLDSKLDPQGWEKGYLDAYMENVVQKKKDRSSSSSNHNRHDQTSNNSSSRHHHTYNSRSKSRDRYRKRHDDSRSRSKSRERRGSRSRTPPSPRRYRSKSRSPPRHHRPTESPQYHYRDRSSSPVRRGRSPPSPRYGYRENSNHSKYNRDRSPPPSSSSVSRQGRSTRRYGRSRSPVSRPITSSGNGRDFDAGAPENRYIGLGSKSAADEFDSFRRNKSQAYNRRDTQQPMVCYKCNKAGHLARECNALV